MLSPKYTLNEIDQSQTVGDIVKNVSAVLIDAEMGPIGITNQLITSPNQFEKTYGGIKTNGTNADSYLQAIRALKNGSALRIVNVKHYSDISDADTLTADFAEPKVSTIYSFSLTLISPNVVEANFANGGIVVSQTFDTTHNKTLDRLASKLLNHAGLKQYGGIIAAKRVGSNIVIIPAVGLTLTSLTISGASPAVTVTATATSAILNSAGDALFAIGPKYPGAKYNDLMVEIEPASNNHPSFFNLSITLRNSLLPKEVYSNILIQDYYGKKFLQMVENNSLIAKPLYLNTTLTAQPQPKPIILVYENGTDGGSIVSTDIIGSSTSQLGFEAFNGYDDIFRLANFITLNDPTAVHQAGSEYATQRKDLCYFIGLTGATSSEVISNKDAMGINSSYTRFYAAGLGLKVLNPDTNTEIYIPPTGDVIGLAAASAEDFGPWYSYANAKRGSIKNALGVGNSWAVSQAELDLLASNQINVIIRKDNQLMIWGNFTGQLQDSLLSFASIRDLGIFLRRSLGPLVSQFIEEPNDIPTWKELYNGVTPFLNNLRDTKRALNKYSWEGDQFANTIDDKELKVNNEADVAEGKYKVRFAVTPINSLQQLTIDIIITRTDVSLEESN